MWVGFVVKHVARKAAIGAGVVVAAVPSTGSGRRIARVLAKSAKAAGEAAIEEIKVQREAKIAAVTIPGVR
jgi:hypothetical protein